MSMVALINAWRGTLPYGGDRSAHTHPLHAAVRLPRTGAAARADHARGQVERLGDPRDVEHLRGGANARGGLRRNHAVAAAAPAGFRNRPHHLLAREALGIEGPH